MSAASFTSHGPASVRNVRQRPQGNEGEAFCYVLNPPLVNGQCSPAQLAALEAGTAEWEDFVVV